MKNQLPKAVLIDLAGVLHVGDHAVPGAVEAMRRLRASGLPLRFLTNTTRSPRAAIVDLLRGLDFEVRPEEIQTAVLATCQFVRERWHSPHYLVHPDVAGEVGPSSAAPDVVVLGDAGPYFTFERMNAAFRFLMDGLPLVAMARNRYFKETDGLTLDMGAYVAALEYAAGTQATVVGKPAAPFFLGALAELGVAPGDAVLIGDDLRDDIGGAQAAGIPGILVRTGKFRPGDDTDPEIRPDLVVADFTAAVDSVLSR
ncbi:MAG: TIGR01458 family HAD-type hydrolase [Betaproteobacteria bacterium]